MGCSETALGHYAFQVIKATFDPFKKPGEYSAPGVFWNTPFLTV